MQFKQYPSYKNSGVEWLGDVPEHWRISSLKRYGYFKGGAGFPHAYQGNTEENIPFFKVNSLSKDQRFLSSFSDFVGEETAKKLGAKIFPKNSIFFAKVGAALLLERIRTNQQPCCIDNNMMGFVIQNELSFNFAFYLMSLIDFKYLVNPGAVPSINESQISSFLISVPPISEQTQIANYLDTETARIDNLISKQEKLIELLEEQRKSIISHAVTKGLNPNAPMKDSGVEWLGDVPSHWDVKSLKFVAEINGRIGFRGYTTNDIVDEGNGAITLSPSNLNYKGLDLEKRTYLSWAKYFESPEIQVNRNDIVLVKTGSSLGKIGFCYFDVNGATINPQLVIIRSKSKYTINPKFLFFCLLMPYFKSKIVSSNKGGTMPTVTQESIGNINLPIPHISIQNEIVKYLDTENLKLDNLISKQQALIDKLKEYRASIISHAVTGKIDVREFGA